MAVKEFPFLRELVEEGTAGLKHVTLRRMFGCDAFFAEDGIFALIWKTGRIGLKLTDDAAFKELMSLEGAEPWRAGPKVMSHWVLVPEDFHDDHDALNEWVKRAYSLALGKGPQKSVSGSAGTGSNKRAKAGRPKGKGTG